MLRIVGTVIVGGVPMTDMAIPDAVNFLIAGVARNIVIPEGSVIIMIMIVAMKTDLGEVVIMMTIIIDARVITTGDDVVLNDIVMRLTMIGKLIIVIRKIADPVRTDTTSVVVLLQGADTHNEREWVGGVKIFGLVLVGLIFVKKEQGIGKMNHSCPLI